MHWTGETDEDGTPKFILPMLGLSHIVSICSVDLSTIASIDKDRNIVTIPEVFPNFVFFWNKSD